MGNRWAADLYIEQAELFIFLFRSKQVTEPCDKGPHLDRIEKKLDKLTEVVTQVAVQRSDIDHLTKQVDSHDKRITEIEKQPAGWLKSIAIAIISAILAVLGSKL